MRKRTGTSRRPGGPWRPTSERLLARYHAAAVPGPARPNVTCLYFDTFSQVGIALSDLMPPKGVDDLSLKVGLTMYRDRSYMRVYVPRRSPLARYLRLCFRRDRRKYHDTVLLHYLVLYLAGKRIPRGWEVHHVDGDHWNNTIENLEIVSPDLHRELHRHVQRKDDAISLAIKGMGCDEDQDLWVNIFFPKTTDRRSWKRSQNPDRSFVQDLLQEQGWRTNRISAALRVLEAVWARRVGLWICRATALALGMTERSLRNHLAALQALALTRRDSNGAFQKGPRHMRGLGSASPDDPTVAPSLVNSTTPCRAGGQLRVMKSQQHVEDADLLAERLDGGDRADVPAVLTDQQGMFKVVTLLLTAAVMSASGPALAKSSLAYSVVVERGGKYVWERIELDGNARRVVASFPDPGAVVAWTARRTHALFRADHPWEVELKTGRTRRLPKPPQGEVDALGYDDRDRVVALTIQPIPFEQQQMDKPYLVFQGRRYARMSYGDSAFAHAFRLDDRDRWVWFETAVTRLGVDGSPGSGVLHAARALRQDPRTADVITPPVFGDESTFVRSPALLRALKPFSPADVIADSGTKASDWVQLPTPFGTIHTFFFSVESAHFTRPVVFLTEGRLEPAEGIPLIKAVDTSTRADYIRLQRRGPYLLVNDEDRGGNTRLYDLRSRRLVFSADSTTDAFFWPTGSSPSHDALNVDQVTRGRRPAPWNCATITQRVQ